MQSQSTAAHVAEKNKYMADSYNGTAAIFAVARHETLLYL